MSKKDENKKRYYAIRTRITYEKTILVPVESVEDVEDAIDIVDENVEMNNIDLFSEEPVYDTDTKGIYELTKEDAKVYPIINDI